MKSEWYLSRAQAQQRVDTTNYKLFEINSRLRNCKKLFGEFSTTTRNGDILTRWAQLSRIRVRKFRWSAAGAGGFVGCARLRRGVFARRSRREHAPSARIPSNFEGENGMNLDWPRAREGARAELVLSGGSICERAEKSAHTNRHESFTRT